MRKNGAQLAVFALEQLGVRYTFGIPGAQDTELGDALRRSEIVAHIPAILENGGAFMADALSRTTDQIGCLTIVPETGLSYAIRGIAEAFLSRVPMLVLSGGSRRYSDNRVKLPQSDRQKMAAGLTKAQFVARTHRDIVPMIFEAYRIATSGDPGPVLVEIPVGLMHSAKFIKKPKRFETVAKGWGDPASQNPDPKLIADLVGKLAGAKNPMLFLGWGAMDATQFSVKIAEKLHAPVAVTLQGKSAFPNDHPLYAGCLAGWGSKPGTDYAFKNHDVLLAVGCRLSELSAAGYALDDPKGLIHINVNPEAFRKNFPADLTVEGHPATVLETVWNKMENIVVKNGNRPVVRKMTVRNEKYNKGWKKDRRTDIVSPGWFFDALNKALEVDDIVVLDNGTHTFPSAELLQTRKRRTLISPSDFNGTGYGIPAAIATKLAHPDQSVVGIVGESSAQMTGNEMITASRHGLSPLIFVFKDGVMGRNGSPGQSHLGEKFDAPRVGFDFLGLAKAAGAQYFKIGNDLEIRSVMRAALRATKGRSPVWVDVHIDFAKKSNPATSVLKENLSRIPSLQKPRFLGRMLRSKLTKP